ncbi:MAG: ATP-binding protein [Thermoanaerobaculia bacterium]
MDLKTKKLRTVYLIFLIHFVAIFGLIGLLTNSYIKTLKNIEIKYARNFIENLEKEIGLHKLTSQGNESVQEILKNLEKNENLKNLKIYDRNDKLVFSMGEKFIKEKELSDKNFILKKGELYFNLEIKNEYPCNLCHQKEYNIIGRAEGKFELNKATGIVETRNKIIFLSLILGFSVFLFIAFFYGNIFLKPLNLLLQGIERIKKGDLNFSLEYSRKDEMGTLISNFNELLLNLKKSKEEIENLHKKEMEKAEHLASIGVIASGLAHEVKNPLAGINAALEILLEEKEFPEEHKNVLIQIKEESRRILNIINSLLDYSRPSKPNPMEFDLETFLKDIEIIIKPYLKTKDIIFKTYLEGENKTIYHDPDLLKRILINLIQNSFQAISDKGQINLKARAAENLIFEVIDDGSGIDEKIKDKIFEPFFTTKIGGTGLGLSVVKKLVQEMDGKIFIDSKIGEGTKVTAVLPLRLKTT